ncbi:MAG: formyl transferase [Acidobacteriia bacterium]|nr:formyl transferase [Terriglobia bacterium]
MDKDRLNKPRIILITGDDLEHRFVANTLSATLNLAGIVVDHGKPQGKFERGRKLWKRYTLGQMFSRAILLVLRTVWRDNSRRTEDVLKVLGPANCSEFSRDDLVSHVNGINTLEGVGVVTSLQPDILLIFGTGIVGKKILSLPSRIALNMHTGISPIYRGCDCTFWPVHNGELHMLGATVHECTALVDGGRIFATARASVEAGDSLFAIFARCVKTGANLYAQTAQQFIGASPEGSVQDLNLGKEYKAFERGLSAEWTTRRKIKAGLIRRYAQSSVESQPCIP